MTIDMIIYFIFMLLIAVLFLYLKLINKDYEDKIEGICKTLDNNLKNIHNLKKELESLNTNIKLLQNNSKNKFDDDMIKNCEYLIHSIIDERLNDIDYSLNGVYKAVSDVEQNQIQTNNTINQIRNSYSSLKVDEEEDKILAYKLHKEGKSIEEIAKILRKSPQVINIILKTI